jgi:phage/plasmid-associated DNA primase
MAMPSDPSPSPMVQISRFTALVDTVPSVMLVPALASQLELPTTSVPKGNNCPGWSPATFSGKRARRNVERVSMLVFDFDAGEPPWERFEGYDFAAHTTHSHTPKAPRWRLILSLTTPIEPQNWGRHLFEAFELADRSWEGAKDASRFFFLPPAGCEWRLNAGSPWYPAPKPAPKKRAPAAPPTAPQAASRWALGALDDACRTMREAPESMRHDTWFAQHAAMAEIVAGGGLTRAVVWAALEDAGRYAFGDEWERRWTNDLQRTRGDAWKQGSQSPRRAPQSNVHRLPVRELKPPTPLEPEPEFVDDEDVDDEPERVIPPPQARVPYPLRPYEPEPVSVPLRDAVPKMYPQDHKSLADFAVARVIAKSCADDGMPLYYAEREKSHDPIYHVYRGGAFREVNGYGLIADCCGQLFGAVTDGVRQQARRAGEEGGDAILEKMAYRATIRDKHAVAMQLCDHLFQQRAEQGDEAGMFASAPPGCVFTNTTIVRRGDGKLVLDAHSPVHKQRHAYGFDYVPGLVPSHTQQVMRDWFRDCDDDEREARILALREFAGVCILNAYPLVKRSVWLHGVAGHDGKTTFQELLALLMPAGSVEYRSPAQLASKITGSDAVASLYGKRLNVATEAGDVVQSLEVLKALLTCEEMQGRRIGAASFAFRPTCGHLLASNTFPKVCVNGPWRRRVLPIEFAAPIPSHMVDRELVGKLLGLEAQAVVCWFVEAALAMLDRGGTYTEPRCVEQAFAEWAEEADPFEAFVASLVPTPGDMAAAPQRQWPLVADAHTAYLALAEATAPKAERLSLKVFAKRFRAHPRLLDQQTGRAHARWSKAGGAARYWILSTLPEPGAARTEQAPTTHRPLTVAELLDLVRGLPTTTRAVWANGAWQQNPNYVEPAPTPKREPAPPRSEPRSLKPPRVADDLMQFDNETNADAEQAAIGDDDRFGPFS